MFYRKKFLHDAAHRTVSHIRTAAEGELPSDFAALRLLAMRRYDLDVQAIRRGGFTAELVQDFAPGDECSPYGGEWTVYYNAGAGEETRLRYLVHELAEYLAICDLPTLFDGLPGTETYHYHGGDNPADVRHRIAFYTEHLYVKSIKSKPSS